jgi:hypothetical protein
MKAPIFVRPLTESECDTLRAGLRLFEALWRVLFECFLFLRSQLLSGRWEVMLDNLTRQTANQIIYHLDNETSLTHLAIKRHASASLFDVNYFVRSASIILAG